MRCSCIMISSRVTLPIEEKGANVDGADRDGAKREGGTAESDCRDLNCTLLRLTITASMAHMTKKWSEEGKGTEKWHKIRMIVEGKMSLSRVAVSLNTSIIERIKCEGKSIVRCLRRERKNRARGLVIEL